MAQRSKIVEVIKFGQLIEYNIRRSFLEKSYTKFGDGEFNPRLFSKKSKLTISLYQQSLIQLHQL